MALPYGSYVVFGQYLPDGDAPQVHMITGPSLEWLQGQLSLSRSVIQYTFNMERADTVIPAWSTDAMSLIAQHYSGQHETELRGLCAAIALGKPFGEDAKRKSDDADGGVRVRSPKPPKAPTGGNKATAGFAALTTGVPS